VGSLWTVKVTKQTNHDGFKPLAQHAPEWIAITKEVLRIAGHEAAIHTLTFVEDHRRVLNCFNTTFDVDR
jgi:hypothetical protein